MTDRRTPRPTTILLIVALLVIGSALRLPAQDDATLRDLADSASYMTGFRFGESLVEQNARLNHRTLLAGVVDALEPQRQPRIATEALEAAAMKADSIERGMLARVEAGDSAFDAQKLLFGELSRNAPESMGVWNDTISYLVGYSYGSNLQQRGLSTRPAAFSVGMRDRLSERAPRIDEQGELLIQLGLSEKKAEAEASIPDYTESDARFMQSVIESGTTEKLENGIIYEVLNRGRNVYPDEGATLVLHIMSRFPNEDPYYDSRAKQAPIVLTLAEVAPFLQEAIGTMAIGALYRVYLPGDVAFAQAPPNVPRRVTIYEIELVGVDE